MLIAMLIVVLILDILDVKYHVFCTLFAMVGQFEFKYSLKFSISQKSKVALCSSESVPSCERLKTVSIRCEDSTVNYNWFSTQHNMLPFNLSRHLHQELKKFM